MGKKYNLKEFIKELREERRRKHGIEAIFISFDGVNSVGKSRQVYHAKAYVNREYPVPIRDIRESQELSDEDIRFREERKRAVRDTLEGKAVRDTLEEDLKFYIEYRVRAWQRIIHQEYCKQRGIVLLERSANSTYVLNAMFRGIKPNTKEAIKLAERVYGPEPIIPPDISLVFVNDVDIILTKARKDAREHGGSKDLFDPYQCEVAYRRMHHGKVADQETMAKWWVTATRRAYIGVGKELPDSHIITIGKDFERLNPITKEVLSSTYAELEKSLNSPTATI